jgi:hypothetical protein
MADDELSDVTIPGEPRPIESQVIRKLTLIASALTTASIVVNVILQIAHFLKKRPVQPDQRDKVQAAGLALTVMRQLPGLIKQVRLLAHEVRRAA